MFEEYYKSQANIKLSQSQIALPTTFGKILAVKEEGFYVDVQLCSGDAGLEPYQNIPTMRSKYYNYPIRIGDFVILLPMSHLQNSFYEMGSFGGLVPASYNSYVAIPISLTMEFLSGLGLAGTQSPEPFTNFFHIRTPQLGTQAYINENEINVSGPMTDWNNHIQNWNSVMEQSWTNHIKQDYSNTVEGNTTLETSGNYKRTTKGNENIEVTGNSDLQVQGNTSINAQSQYDLQIQSTGKVTCQGKLTIQSSTPITIQTGETLGALIAEGFNLIASSMTGPIPQAPSGISVGATMANGGQLTAVATRILQVVT